MTTKFYHGNINVGDLMRALVTRFNKANLRASGVLNDGKAVVQIHSPQHSRSGGNTALGVTLIQNEDGISVTLGEQAWFGIAASLGFSALTAIKNPLNILERLDDIAQDLENLQLDDQVWKVIGEVAKATGASQELSEKFRRLECEYCGVANTIGDPDCNACGAPLGAVQPGTCPHCGFVVKKNTKKCPNCGKKIALR